MDNNYLGRGNKKYERDMKLCMISYIGILISIALIIITQ